MNKPHCSLVLYFVVFGCSILAIAIWVRWQDAPDTDWIVRASNPVHNRTSAGYPTLAAGFRAIDFLDDVIEVESSGPKEFVEDARLRFYSGDLVDSYLWVCHFCKDDEAADLTLDRLQVKSHGDWLRATQACWLATQNRRSRAMELLGRIESHSTYITAATFIGGIQTVKVDSEQIATLLETAIRRLLQIDVSDGAASCDFVYLAAGLGIRCHELDYRDLAEIALNRMEVVVRSNSSCASSRAIAAHTLVILGRVEQAAELLNLELPTPCREEDAIGMLPGAILQHRDEEFFAGFTDPVVRAKIALLRFEYHRGTLKEASSWQGVLECLSNLGHDNPAAQILKWYLSDLSGTEDPQRLVEVIEGLTKSVRCDPNPVSQYSNYRLMSEAVWIHLHDGELARELLQKALTAVGESFSHPGEPTGQVAQLDSAIVSSNPQLFQGVGYELCIQSFLEFGMMDDAMRLLRSIRDPLSRNDASVEVAASLWSLKKTGQAVDLIRAQDRSAPVSNEKIAARFASHALRNHDWERALAMGAHLGGETKRKLITFLAGAASFDAQKEKASIPQAILGISATRMFRLGQEFAFAKQSSGTSPEQFPLQNGVVRIDDWSTGNLRWIKTQKKPKVSGPIDAEMRDR